MTRCRHDLEVIVAVSPPVIDACMTEVVEDEAFDACLSRNQFMYPSNLIRSDRLPVPMEDTIAIQGSHLQNFSQDFYQLRMDRDRSCCACFGVF
jgi:hypothetical protein